MRDRTVERDALTSLVRTHTSNVSIVFIKTPPKYKKAITDSSLALPIGSTQFANFVGIACFRYTNNFAQPYILKGIQCTIDSMAKLPTYEWTIREIKRDLENDAYLNQY